MKYLWIAVIGLSLASQPRPRFQYIYGEDMETAPREITLTVIHDAETGQEIVCARSGVSAGYSISCWLTGRNWK
jgi:hypothetical protein